MVSKRVALVTSLLIALLLGLGTLQAQDGEKQTIRLKDGHTSSLTVALQEDGQLELHLQGENYNLERVVSTTELAALVAAEIQVKPDPGGCDCASYEDALAKCSDYVEKLESDLKECEEKLAQC